MNQIEQRLQAIEAELDLLRTIATPYYDSGTYTPTYLGGTTPGTTTYTFQDGAWVRVGSMIVVRGQINWSGATGTGNAQVSLPFAASGGNFAGALYLTGVTFANSAPEILCSSGNTFFTMGSPLTNAAPTVVQVEAVGQIIFTIAYFL